MVGVKSKSTGVLSKEKFDIDSWLTSINQGRPENEVETITKAFHFANHAHLGQVRVSGEPYLYHSLAVANILADLHMDYESIGAAILHDVVEDTKISTKDIEQEFGSNIARLVDGVTKMSIIQAFQSLPIRDKKEKTQAESLRKMLLAMAEDVRVVLIKLADRVHNMRTLNALSPEKQKRVARETIDIYAPLANRLGIWQLKWELEDLSLRYLDPNRYKQIARMVDEKRVDRERYINRFIAIVRKALDNEKIEADISGRPKHIYSIWRKMEQKKIDYTQVYDLRGIRILLTSLNDCYTTLGIIHSKWQYIKGEFDDYIATPKGNNYQSIHTAVIGPEGKTIEVQIRTHEMHEQNEYGVAAHWRYKEGKVSDAQYDEKITWLRQLMEWKDEIADASDFIDQVKTDVFQDRIYVFTPKGNVIDMPAGATPLDFAYQIHTEVGHRCRGAKVNGKMVQLTYPLQTGQQVEIITVKRASPSRDWLNPHLGYLKTSRARAKVLHWFKFQDRDKNIIEGRNILERELKRLGMPSVNLERLAEKLHFDNTDDLFIAVAHSEIKPTRYVTAAQNLLEPQKGEQQVQALPQKIPRLRKGRSDIKIQGIGNLLTRMANCCKPLPGDEILGYITIGQGVTVHRADCKNILRNYSLTPDRIIEISWGSDNEKTYPVDIEIKAYDRQGLLRDITSIFANEKVNLLAANTLSNQNDNLASMRLTVEISNIDLLSRVLAKIEQLPNVIESRRISI